MPQHEIEVILTRELAGYLAMAIFVVDPAGSLIFYNEPAEALLGTRFEETGPMEMDDWAHVFDPRDEDGSTARAGVPAPRHHAARRPADARPVLDPRPRRHPPPARGDGHPADRAGRPAPGRGGHLLGGRRRVRVTFWGTRGSLASPGLDTVRYGGNTCCVEVRTDGDDLVVLDAGTGIRRLGQAIPDDTPPRRRAPVPPPHGPHPGPGLLRLPLPGRLPGPPLGPGLDHDVAAARGSAGTSRRPSSRSASATCPAT